MAPDALTAAIPAWAEVTDARREHVGRVMTLLERWASATDVSADERARWLRAAALHDALKDAPVDRQRALAAEAGLDDLAPALLHGPAAAVRAARDGEADRGVLLAVTYHSIGHPDWDRVGRMLYLADYLEPGRTYHDSRRAAYAKRVPDTPDDVLRAVVAERLRWLVKSAWPVRPETVGLWNALVG